MSWYRIAQEEDNDIMEDAMKEYYADEVVNKTKEIRTIVRDAISKRLNTSNKSITNSTTGKWWMEMVEPFLVSEINSDPDIVHSPDKIQMVANWVAGCALIGKTTGWHWMKQCLTEMDSELVKALIIMIDNGWITNEVTLEEALDKFDYVMEDSNNKPGDSIRIAHEITLRMQAKKEQDEDGNNNESITQYYIKATGSTCYDSSGITYPEKQPVNWLALLFGTANRSWENNLGMSNQPKVITFDARSSVAKNIDLKLPPGLMVSEHWSNS
jgi:hypothetical protein